MIKKCDICGNDYKVYTINKKKRGLNIPVKMFINVVNNKFTIATKNVRNICIHCIYKVTIDGKDSIYGNKIVEDGKDGITFKTFE